MLIIRHVLGYLLGCALLLPMSVVAADSSGRFIQPKTAASASGNLLLSVHARDEDVLSRVHVSFNQNGRVLELCQSVAQCRGSSFNTTRANIDPGAYGASPGPLSLQLWVTDSGGNSTAVATTDITWQPVGRSTGRTGACQ